VDAKVEIGPPQGLYTKAVIEKNFSIFPKLLLINTELYGCALVLSFSFHHFMLDISFEIRVILKLTLTSTLIFYPVDLVTFFLVLLSIKSQKDLTK
jgi:hypothetical protein